MNNIYFSSIFEELFSALNEAKIPYFLMRDYQSAETVQQSEDVDVVLDENTRDEANRVIICNGWQTPKNNINFYGHQQYFKWDGKRVVKLDVIYGLYFANGLYSINDQASIFSNVREYGIARIPKSLDGLLIHICHLIYDKKEVSDKNRRFLEYLVDNITEENGFLVTCAKCLLYESNVDTIINLGSDLCSKDIVKKHSNFLVKARWFYKRCQAHIFQKKTVTIAIIGVDGTGKSTSIDAIKNYYGNAVASQYMGFRLFQTKLAKSWYGQNKRIPILSFFIDCIMLPYEMWYRYKHALSEGKEIVLFDRYPWEIYDNSRGIARVINYLLFKVLFTKPDGIIYLYCRAETSLSRKTDIEDEKAFKLMKENFDKQYKEYPGALVLNTDNEGVEEVRNRTIAYVSVLNNLK